MMAWSRIRSKPCRRPLLRGSVTSCIAWSTDSAFGRRRGSFGARTVRTGLIVILAGLGERVEEPSPGGQQSAAIDLGPEALASQLRDPAAHVRIGDGRPVLPGARRLLVQADQRRQVAAVAGDRVGRVAALGLEPRQVGCDVCRPCPLEPPDPSLAAAGTVPAAGQAQGRDATATRWRSRAIRSRNAVPMPAWKRPASSLPSTSRPKASGLARAAPQRQQRHRGRVLAGSRKPAGGFGMRVGAAVRLRQFVDTAAGIGRHVVAERRVEPSMPQSRIGDLGHAEAGLQALEQHRRQLRLVARSQQQVPGQLLQPPPMPSFSCPMRISSAILASSALLRSRSTSTWRSTSEMVRPPCG